MAHSIQKYFHGWVNALIYFASACFSSFNRFRKWNKLKTSVNVDSHKHTYYKRIFLFRPLFAKSDFHCGINDAPNIYRELRYRESVQRKMAYESCVIVMLITGSFFIWHFLMDVERERETEGDRKKNLITEKSIWKSAKLVAVEYVHCRLRFSNGFYISMVICCASLEYWFRAKVQFIFVLTQCNGSFD